MTSTQLIDEGRKLAKPCVFLLPEGCGPVAAVWHNSNSDDEIDSQGRLITVKVGFIPGKPLGDSEFISILVDELRCEGGRVEMVRSWPESGTLLYAHPTSILPPLEVVFARGSTLVGEWLAEIGWERNERYNDNFKDHEIAGAYLSAWQKEFPLYFESDIYAILGGWHWPGPDPDWYDLMEEQLLVLTLWEAEPWVEAWRLNNGAFRIITRIT